MHARLNPAIRKRLLILIHACLVKYGAKPFCFAHNCEIILRFEKRFARPTEANLHKILKVPPAVLFSALFGTDPGQVYVTICHQRMAGT